MWIRFLGALLLSQIAMAVPMVAQARSEYDHSDPAAGATVATAPSSVTVVFTQELVPQGSSLEVRDVTNARVDADNSRVVDATPKNTMTIGLKSNLPAGVYTVVWKTVSAVDSAENSGTFTFAIGVPAPAAPSAAAGGTGATTRPLVSEGPNFDITGTVVAVQASDNTMDFLTSDVTGSPVTIRIDISDISKRNISKGDSMTITIAPRQFKLPEALVVVEQGSYTEGSDFSPAHDPTVNERSQVQNFPDDDEARNKQKHEKGKED